MGYSGLNIGGGIQRLVDAQMRYINAARTPIALRFRNFSSQQSDLYAQLGYRIAPGGNETGTTDVTILPAPGTKLVSMHNIGMSQGKLRFGAREFVVSATFVNAQQSALGLSTPDQLWSCQQFVGLVGYGVLWTVELYASDDIGGIPVVWTLNCNANEQR